MKMIKNSVRGSVCISLTLLMLPLYSFALACTDCVKISSAERMVSKAEDLGLIAAMSNYNTLLQKTYGLYAVSDIAEAESDLTECFEESLPLKMETEIFNNTISFEKECVSVEFPNYAVLANPEILKYQISEYFRYEEYAGMFDILLSKLKDREDILDHNISVSDNMNSEKGTAVSDISKEEAVDFFKQISQKKDISSEGVFFFGSDKSEIINKETEKIEELFGKSNVTDPVPGFFEEYEETDERKKSYEKYFYDALTFTKKLFCNCDLSELSDDICTTEYIMKHFSCITDEKKQYSDESFTFSSANNLLFGKESEYIIFGDENTEINIESMKNCIFAVRFVLNCISVFNDSNIQAAAEIAAAAASLVTGVPESVYRYLFLFCYAAVESESDVEKLVSGEKVPLYKSCPDIQIKNTDEKSPSKHALISEPELDYRDYMRLFILYSLQNEKSERNILIRTAAVIDSNMKYGLSDYKNDEEKYFEITQAYTVIEINPEVKTDMMLPDIFDGNSNGKQKKLSLRKIKSF